MTDWFPSEIYEPRLTDRAYVHLIYESELPGWKDLDWVTTLHGGDNDDLRREVKRILEIRGDEVRRGDLIYLEPFLYENPRFTEEDKIKLDEGKLIFDGLNVMPLDFILATYRNENQSDRPYFIPEQFQVIVEFPIRYWQGRIHNFWVNFNFKKHIGPVSPTEIQLMRRQSRDPIPYFMFTSEGEIFVISLVETVTPVLFSILLEANPGFVYDLSHRERFHFTRGELFKFDIPNPENVLYIP